MFSNVIQFVREAPSRMMGFGASCMLSGIFIILPIAIMLDDQRTVEIEYPIVAAVAFIMMFVGPLLVAIGARTKK